MKKIPVAILGATGMVGQRFVELLVDHPVFEIAALAASEKSQGKKYAEAMRWMMATPLPSAIAEMKVESCMPTMDCQVVFSGLDAEVAGGIEESFAKAGYTVISNARNHRMHPQVPLLIPEVNSDHLGLLPHQSFRGGKIVTNPNCSVIGIAMALKPLLDRFGLEKVHVVTMQAVSGAGYPGVAGFDILDNVIPYISGEEEKVQSEPLKVLGSLKGKEIVPHGCKLSAHCNRVAVMDGHMACLSVTFEQKAEAKEIIEAWESFRGIPQELGLHTAPKMPLFYHRSEYYPQPKLHRDLGNRMTVSLGGLRRCDLFGWKFTILSHNTVRGAAGCALLNAELMHKLGYL